MIAKITTGNSFSATVDYDLDEKKKAELIDSEGVRTKDNGAQVIVNHASAMNDCRDF
jgi:hypothetical protein